MTKKHFEAFAEQIRCSHSSSYRMIGIERLKCSQLVADVCEKFNTNFNREKFMNACGVGIDYDPISDGSLKGEY